MAKLRMLDRASADSLYHAAVDRYDARLTILDKSMVDAHHAMVDIMQSMDIETKGIMTECFYVAQYLDRVTLATSIARAWPIYAWNQMRADWYGMVNRRLIRYHAIMAGHENKLAALYSQLVAARDSRKLLLPEVIQRTMGHARSCIPVSNTVLVHGKHAFVVKLESSEDVYSISIRTHDDQIKVFSSARSHDAAKRACAMVDALLAHKYTIADGDTESMVIDKHDGTCTMRTMVDPGCQGTLRAMRKLAAAESKNVLPFERVKRVFYTVDHASLTQCKVTRSTMPTTLSDCSSMIMVRKQMHGTHVQACEYALSESIMIAYGIPVESALYYQLEIPRATIRLGHDAHDNVISRESQTIDRVNLYIVDRHDARLENLIADIKASSPI